MTVQQQYPSTSTNTADLWENKQIFEEAISDFENQGMYFF